MQGSGGEGRAGPLISIGIKKNMEPDKKQGWGNTPLPRYLMALQQVVHGCLDRSVACTNKGGSCCLPTLPRRVPLIRSSLTLLS
jgi:hypothetical protein